MLHPVFRVAVALVALCTATIGQAATVTVIPGTPVSTTTDFTGHCSSVVPTATCDGQLIETVTENVTTIAGIAEVLVPGFAPYVYADLASAPSLSEQALALSDTLAALGLGPSDVAGTGLTALPSTSSSTQTTGLDTGPDLVFVGDLDDLENIAILQGTIEAITTIETTVLQPYRLDVTLAETGTGDNEGPTPVPLPAAGLMLATGLAGLTGFARGRRKG